MERTYNQAAISKFLSDVYAPSAAEGRYSFIPGEGLAGVVVYDNKFSYSHHATDPTQGRLLNAFDLVRLHRFGDTDEKTSFNNMRSLAEKGPLVKETAVSADECPTLEAGAEECSSDPPYHLQGHNWSLREERTTRRTSRVYAGAVMKKFTRSEATDKDSSILSKGTAFTSMIDMHFFKCLKLVSLRIARM